MLDDMEQWFEEERKEVEESTNIFFNGNIQNEFYQAALEDLVSLRSQWENWIPDIPVSKVPNNNFSLSTGQTPIKIVLTWIKMIFIILIYFQCFIGVISLKMFGKILIPLKLLLNAKERN